MSTRPTDNHWIAVKTAAVLSGSGVLIWMTEDRVMSRVVFSGDLGWALSVAAVFGASLTLLLLMVTIFRIRDQRREARSARVAPVIRQEIAACLAGGSRRQELEQLSREYPDETGQCFRDLFLVLKGRTNKELIELANAVGLRQLWELAYRQGTTEERVGVVRCLAYLASEAGPAFLAEALADPDPDVGIEAARTLAEMGNGDSVEDVYDYARRQSLMVRAILAEDLRPHLSSLARGIVASDLASRNAARIRHALQMMRAWSTPLAVSLDPLLEHQSLVIRVEALGLLNLIHITGDTPGRLRRNLQDQAEKVVEAAALAAGRLHLDSLLPELSCLLSRPEAAVCRAAARALSAMGHFGPLEDKIRTGGSPGAEAALEAVQKAHTGHDLYARVG